MDSVRAGCPPAGSFRRDIEGLRGVAILFVLLVHAQFPAGEGILFPRGYIGVDIFFVISGYLITSILARPDPRPIWRRLSDFYINRIVRLAPALIVMVSIIMSSSMLSGVASAVSEDAADAIATLFYVENFRMMQQSLAGVDINLSPWPFSHAWTLGVEAQFYLLFAPFLLFLAKMRLRYMLLLFAAVVLPVTWLVSSSTLPGFMLLLLPGRLFPLILGATIALLPPIGGRASAAVAAAGLAALVALIIGYAPSLPSLITPVLTAILVAPTVWRAGASDTLSRALGSRPLGFIGRISYSLYLWHWPIVGAFSGYGAGLAVERSLLIIGLSVLAAVVSRKVIEEPFLRAKDGERRKIAIVCVLITVLLALELSTIAG
jgi:peptidoglycan/LPS O-acetylase OafA/YrhL